MSGSEENDEEKPHHGSSVEAYTVGYGKPPLETRWKKGQSGNPGGRKKKALSFAEDLIDELSRHITISEGGRPTRITKSRALVKSMLSNSLRGKVGTTRLTLERMDRLGLTQPREKPADDGWLELTEEVLDELIAKAIRVKAIRARRTEQGGS